ncbi:MAG: hypothetical protein LBE12_10250 [Planctomycetaceae bacterium]|jgi:hypothetical protein|nr:hypothetical protein [Planctomycetaceae bacterium]
MSQESAPSLNEILLRMNKIEKKQTLQALLIQELQANSVPQPKTSKNKKTKETKRINANAQVIALLMKCSDKVWMSDELAEKIGCTGAAVRKTQAWKGYQKQKAGARQQCSIRKGSKDKNDNINAATEDDEIDY